MPDQAAYDRALALAQVVLGKLYPAYVRCLLIPLANSNVLLERPSIDADLS